MSYKSVKNLKITAFTALFFSLIAVGCTTSDANEAERLMAELETQMEVAQQEVEEAITEYRESDGDIKDDVRRRIEDARRELQRARAKLQELHESGFEEEYGDVYEEHRERHERQDSDSDHNGSERIRIRVNGDTVVDLESHSSSGHNNDAEYDYDYNYDFDVNEDKIEAAFEKLGHSIEKMVNAIENDSDVNAVDAGDLADLFHDEVAGMERVNINSDRDGGFGFSITTVEAKYRGQRTELKLTVVDLGSLAGIAREGMNMIDTDIDKKSENEYIRTDEVEGYPATIHFESSRGEDKLGVAIFVGERFIVAMEAEGTDLTEELIDDVFDDFDLNDLEGLD